MGTTYAMGTFNDNFFKQAALLLAATVGLQAAQGLATFLFALPFVLFSVWAGWLADFLPKKTIVVGSKFLELFATLLGLWALLTMNWAGIVGMVCLMGLQSTLFSPALNGAIPENFPAGEVPRVNALLKAATTVTILLGIALGSMLLDLPSPEAARAFLPEGVHSFGRLLIGGGAVLVAIVGLAAAFAIHKSPSPRGGAPFPRLGPVDSARHALECYTADKPLFLVLAGEAFFYGLSSFVVLAINNLGVTQLGLSKTLTGLLSVALMVGICLGALRAGRHAASSWRRFMLPAGVGMAVGLLAAAAAPLLPDTASRLLFLLPVFTFAGACGGFFLIPLVSFIQLRPRAAEKGKVLGISNFASFSGVALSGLAFMLLGNASPSGLLVVAATAALLFMLWAAAFLRRLPAVTLEDKTPSLPGLLLRALLSLRYRVSTTGLENIPADNKPLLLMPNHPALVDSSIVYSLVAGLRPRPLGDERQVKGPLGSVAAKLSRAILIPDPGKEGTQARQGVEEGIQTAAEALRKGEAILFYPSGRLLRSSRECLGGNSGVATLLAAAPEARVVLVRITGLWGSSFSYAAKRGPPSFAKALWKGALTLVANAVFFTPRREVRVEFVESSGLPRGVDKRVLNAWLEAFYNEAERPPMAVPRFFWQGRVPVVLPDYTQTVARVGEGARPAVSEVQREAVYASLRKAAKLSPGHVLTEGMTLGGELGLDSISLMDLVAELEAGHGKPIHNLEALVTVGDCLAAIADAVQEAAAEEGEAEEKPAPAGWFAPTPLKDLRMPEGATTVPDAFMAILREAPNAPLAADRSGLRTRREILTGALVLSERFKTLPGKRLGILLPSVPAVTVVWLAAQLAGKEAVFLNWTSGEVNLRHCIALTGVRYVVSASALLSRLERGGLRVNSLPVTWLRLENMAASLTRREKLKGFIRARFMRSFAAFPIAEVAAVLFTSGSEAMPKAVPLSHTNLLSNAKDIMDILELQSTEAILAMLPPFHSFGLVTALILPLALGLKAAYHPNPTEAAALVSLTRDFRLTLLAAPPTFLEAMLEKAEGTDAFQSLRYAFVGAEKCAEHIYRAFAKACPFAILCEGYGITECSPVVSANWPKSIVIGSIGHAMPSVHVVVVREEEGRIMGRAETGETGMLLARGPNIFSGYLGDAPNPFVSFEGHTWYRTGDLVSMDETGRMTFRGRLKRFVKVGGEMISLPQVEGVLLEAFAGHPGAPAEGPLLAVEASPEEAGAEVVVFTPLPLGLLEVNAALREAGLSALHSVKRVVLVKAIPLLGSGKTDYRALKARL
jgi:acyl-CoA synthetase (AMP-forming)/AMP-acid ligase II/1-acyl-sn-glycerol-3-phosphate acyltransferase/acyl carrier protein